MVINVLEDKANMMKLSGENWSGSLCLNNKQKAYGRVNGYSWYFQSKNKAWFVEIAEEHVITPHELPLVGYGCGGWLYECNDVNLPNADLLDESVVTEAYFVEYVQVKLSLVFQLFGQNKLSYLPAVSCPCSD